jgi:hypothetical protein
LVGVPLRIDFVSVMAQALKSVGLASLDRLTIYVGGIVKETGDTSILDKIDFDQAVDEYGDMTGVPPRIIRPDDQVAAIRQSRAKQLQAQQAAEQAATLAPAAKQLSETQMGGDTALNALMGTGGTAPGIAGLLPAGSGV